MENRGLVSNTCEEVWNFRSI